MKEKECEFELPKLEEKEYYIDGIVEMLKGMKNRARVRFLYLFIKSYTDGRDF